MKCTTKLFAVGFAWLVTSMATKANDLPIVPAGFAVDVVAREPLVRNPCVLAFDRLGRLCVAHGQQWRAPTPETPGDRVDILLDTNGDGEADQATTFAEGLNCIQGMAWHGGDLWIANSPDLTVVRDTDGDDVADVYIKVYTGLGNLEHALHGLNFGPDGKLYMSKGNSKGYNRVDQLAPRAFRELWGIESPNGAPDYTEVETFTKKTYRRAYHTPNDDWGQQGGILRCDPYSLIDGKSSVKGMGRNLEVFSQGFRNPWDICFDDSFDWLGTDNDQTEGDKVFAPFNGAHFGWGHPWSFDWKGINHLPTIPISMPLYEGSGTGVIHYNATHFPPEYRDVFFVNDWMRREVYLFEPEWLGAFRRHVGGGFPSVFAHAEGGRSLPASSGRIFEPTDIEVGPDGALYILSWGHGYGGSVENGKQIDAGRVYRIRHATRKLLSHDAAKRQRQPEERSFTELLEDLGGAVPAWRVSAQVELLKRGERSRAFLANALRSELTRAQQTWSLWTLGRLSPASVIEFVDEQSNDINARLQAIRVVSQVQPMLIDSLLDWTAENARIRHAVVQAVRQARRADLSKKLIELVSGETDRIVFYSAWNAMNELMTVEDLKVLLSDSRPRVRLAALLALLLDDDLTSVEVLQMRRDNDSQVASVVELWLQKTGNGVPLISLSPPPGEYGQSLSVTARSSIPRSVLTYTTDGSVPAMTSQRVDGPIKIDRDVKLRFSIFQDYLQAGAPIEASYAIRHNKKFRHRQFIKEVTTDSGRRYEIDWEGLTPGKRHYTDRNYQVLEVPSELLGLPFMRTANADDRRIVQNLVSFRSDSEVKVFLAVDSRNLETLSWMKIGEPDGFREAGLTLLTDDPEFKVYSKWFPAGEIHLGPNINRPNDSGRGNYIAIFGRRIIHESAGRDAATMGSVLASMPKADPQRGRELFFHPQGAGCSRCHQMQGIGEVLGPDLSDIGSRARKADIIIESILDPSKVITEGFAQQKVLTKDDRVITGAVLEETGRLIKIASSDGVVITVSKDEIVERVGTHTSPMPNGFGAMLTAQQIADVTAWLLTQKVVGDRDGFWFQDVGDRLHINLGSQRIATYLKSHSLLTRRALVNVTTQRGVSVTRNFPPRRPEDIDPGHKAEGGIIHPVMHPGIWISFGDVSGNDYWRLQSDVVFDQFSGPPQGNLNNGSFTAVNRLLDREKREEVCRETTRYQFRRVQQGWLLRIDAAYQSNERDFYFGDQEESGLAVRVAFPLRVQGGGGMILNNRGEKNGGEIWGKEARWFDYVVRLAGREVGVMIAPSPKNPRRSWLHARDYGVVVTNPFPKQPTERREAFVKTHVKKGEKFQLSYAILIHDLPETKPLDHEIAADILLREFEE